MAAAAIPAAIPAKTSRLRWEWYSNEDMNIGYTIKGGSSFVWLMSSDGGTWALYICFECFIPPPEKWI
jgi:hypothetical protein